MAYVPFIPRYDTGTYRMEQELGVSLGMNDVLMPSVLPSTSVEYHHPWKIDSEQIMGSVTRNDKNKFVINLDVHIYAPEEISVRAVNGCLIIEAKHDEKKDMHGLISRHFSRRYALPEGTNTDLIESKISAHGILTVVAPRPILEVKKERIIPIIQAGAVRTEIKDDNPNPNPQSSSDGSQN